VLPVWLFEAKFLLFVVFPTPLAFFSIFEKRPNEIWPFLANSIFYVYLADLKMILADFWALTGY